MTDAMRASCFRAAGRLLADGLAACIVFCLLMACAWAQAADVEGGRGVLERDVKAAYLYKFLGYVEWPSPVSPRPGSPFVIGIAGADDIADELSRIAAGRHVNNRGVTVKRLDGADSLAGIHLLFIGRGESGQETQLLRMAQKQPILTVTETENAFASGSIINFRLIDGRVRFEVSLAAAERSNLKLSSRLLSVAASVQGNPR